MSEQDDKKLLVFTRRLRPEYPRSKALGIFQHPFSRAVSRLDYKPDLFRYRSTSESVREILGLKNLGLTWTECCDQNAIDLLALNREKYYVLYSGGIDSTCVLVSLLRNWNSASQKKIQIVLSSRSVLENPSFFRDFVSHFPLIPIYGIDKVTREENCIFVTGELGDQLFGTDMLTDFANSGDESLLYAPYTETAEKVISAAIQFPEFAKAIFEHIQPIVSECPFPVRTTHDFFWWYNFTQRWQYDKLKYLGFSGPLSNPKLEFCHFFSDSRFQQWSIYNHDLKIKKDWDSYKYVAKDYIFSFTKNRESSLNLLKRASFKQTFFFSRFALAVDDNFKAITDEAELELYRIV